MTRLALALLLGVSACAPRPEAPRAVASDSAAFDAAAWLARARPTASVYPGGAFDERALEDSARAAELDAAVGWERACDLSWNVDAQAFTHNPDVASRRDASRGLYSVTDITPGEAVVTVLCDTGAYLSAGAYVLVHVAGRRAALLVAQGDEAVRDQPLPPGGYPTPTLSDGSARFTTLATGRGLADCGLFSTYQIERLGVATLVEARALSCDDADTYLRAPAEWPVVYPRP